VTISSLILEPIIGMADTYRRIGTAGKRIYVSEVEHANMLGSDSSKTMVPQLFSSWDLKVLLLFELGAAYRFRFSRCRIGYLDIYE